MQIIRITLLLYLFLPCHSVRAEEIVLQIGSRKIRAEIADTPQSREHGLMQRKYLCADCGMLFVFDRADRYAFWMKNTPLPLSIAFIAADGRIINIEEMQPGTTSLHQAQGEALYALEMNNGWFDRNSIRPSSEVRGLLKHTRRF